MVAKPSVRPRGTSVYQYKGSIMSVNQGKADVSVWDKEEALSRLMDSPALLDEACSIFVEESEQQLPSMEKQLANADYAALAREAHKMKGSAGNLAALELHQQALTLEQAAKQEAAEQAAAALADVKEGLARFCAQLTH
ncbi:hypothetical protein BZG00_14515 [Salinivibrio kushneri]|uniref:HPt domain-containing protein n=2 Tax=Salinivibrio kushneri TaxID=1908198 RepID=A0AB36JR92_9GAMM|nr:hypothetical protein BZG00_14515 [Salinivibrio kushneri]